MWKSGSRRRSRANIIFDCAEYCGRGHSDMAATLYVDDDAAYQKWLETGGVDPNMPLDKLGAMLYEQQGLLHLPFHRRHARPGTVLEGRFRSSGDSCSNGPDGDGR